MVEAVTDREPASGPHSPPPPPNEESEEDLHLKKRGENQIISCTYIFQEEGP